MTNPPLGELHRSDDDAICVKITIETDPVRDVGISCLRINVEVKTMRAATKRMRRDRLLQNTWSLSQRRESVTP